MPVYSIIFETIEGQLKYEVTIEDQELLSDVMGDLLADLEDQGHRLVGGGSSSIEVVWNGKPLNGDIALSQQGVQPRDTLIVRTAARAPEPVQAPPPPTLVVEKPETYASIKTAYVVAAFVPMWALQYLGLHSSSIVFAIVAALAACVVAFGLWSMLWKTPSGRWSELLPFITTLAALVAGLLVARLKLGSPGIIAGQQQAYLTIIPAVALGFVGIARALEQNRSVCAIGGERFSGTRFVCPRCQQVCCNQHWVAARFRCTNCEEQETPWLSMLGDSWWDERIGPTVRQGICVSCNSTPQSQNVFQVRRDMRECQKCGSLQCRWCWDLNNGKCPKCSWAMPQLPANLHGGQAARKGGKVGL
jgi:hypothetical protein